MHEKVDAAHVALDQQQLARNMDYIQLQELEKKEIDNLKKVLDEYSRVYKQKSSGVRASYRP